MTTLVACVDEKVIIIFDQLETHGRKNVKFLLGLVCEYCTEQLIYW